MESKQKNGKTEVQNVTFLGKVLTGQMQARENTQFLTLVPTALFA